MLFSSSIFLFLFLPVAILGYRLLHPRYRIYFLTLVSLFFYAWGEPKYILLMLFSILFNYCFGLLIHANANGGKGIRRIILLLTILGNLGILFYFKYFNFALSGVNALLHTDFAYANIIMPIGISFFTFQGLSYVIDLYWGNVKVQKNPAYVAFYISFFPQLIAGPIVRYIDIEEQIYKRDDSLEQFVAGIKRFVVGLAKKTIIANTVGFTADQIFNTPVLQNTALTAWLGIFCYAFQIYFDFSGYSDMAIGLGKMFGFDFLENFNYPYISKTVSEFWRRWHMSLSSWFRDYLYIPLGGNRTGNVYFNLFMVFLVTGIWHGASLNFIVWGLWHGLFLIIERKFKINKVQNQKFAPLRYLITMLIVLIGWVFFRVENLPDALSYLGIMFGLQAPVGVGFNVQYYLSNKLVVILGIAVIASLPLMKTKWMERLKSMASWETVSNIATLLLFFVSIVFVVAASYNPFIYFRF